MDTADRRRVVDNLQAELDGAALYRALAEIEDERALATVYTRMAEAEERHANIWRTKLREGGVTAVPTQPGWRTRSPHRIGTTIRAGLHPPNRDAA